MAKEALYSLVQNEEVLFELKITGAKRSDRVVANAANLIKSLLPNHKEKNSGSGVFVVTNMRCIVAMQKKDKIPCILSTEERFFWTFPLESLNGNNGYSSEQATCCCCCKDNSFSLEIGMKGLTLTVDAEELSNHEQAQAVVAKLVALSQQAKK